MKKMAKVIMFTATVLSVAVFLTGSVKASVVDENKYELIYSSIYDQLDWCGVTPDNVEELPGRICTGLFIEAQLKMYGWYGVMNVEDYSDGVDDQQERNTAGMIVNSIRVETAGLDKNGE